MKEAGSIHDLRSTVFVSCILHACFFAAVLFWSAYIMTGGRITPNEKVIYVQLGEDTVVQRKKNEMPGLKRVASTVVPAITEITAVKKDQEPVIQPEKAAAQKTTADTEISGSSDNGGLQATEPLEGITEKGLFGGTDISSPGGIDGISQEEIISSGPAEGVLSPDILRLIGGAIEKAKTYPLIARKQGMEGTVFVSFKIGSDGTPRDLLVLKSSGFEVLDTATLDAIKRAAPYPNVQSRVEVPVAYRLKE